MNALISGEPGTPRTTDKKSPFGLTFVVLNTYKGPLEINMLDWNMINFFLLDPVGEKDPSKLSSSNWKKKCRVFQSHEQ